MASNSFTRLETIKDDVWKLYEKIINGIKDGVEIPVKDDARLEITKACLMKHDGVVKCLQEFKKRGISKEMTNNIDIVISCLGELEPDGMVKRYCRYHTKTAFKNDLEYICLAVRKYISKRNVEVYDFTLATYAYSKGVDYAGLGAGAGLLSGACALAGFAAFGFMTGGAGYVAAGITSLLASIGSAVTGGVAIGEAANCTMEGDFQTVLEAAFIYELVQRGHARVNEETRVLYLINEDSDGSSHT